MEGTTIIERNPDQTQLTRRYTERAYQFIRDNKDGPFFLYLPHSMPHTPVFASNRFRGTSSARGLYGDCMAEVDWSVGVILNALSDFGIDNNTLVIFTSDNGPWLIRPDDCRGCAKPLRDGKWSVYEGGMRVPCVMRWPGSGHIPAGTVCGEVAATIDILPTLALLAGTTAPTDGRVIDGKDIRTLMTNPGGATSPHEYYFMRTETVRSGNYKLHTAGTDKLFDLSTNISESNDAAAEAFAAANPAIADPMRAALAAHNTDLASNSRPPFP
jgi:arylsulfatase A-like enzyme